MALDSTFPPAAAEALKNGMVNKTKRARSNKGTLLSHLWKSWVSALQFKKSKCGGLRASPKGLL